MKRRSLEEAVALAIEYVGVRVDEILEVEVFVHDEDACYGEMELKWDIYTSAEGSKKVYDLLNPILNCDKCIFYVDADSWETGGSVTVTYRWSEDSTEVLKNEVSLINHLKEMGICDVPVNEAQDLNLISFTEDGSEEYESGRRESYSRG